MTKSLLIASLIAAAGLVACGKTEEPAPAPAPAAEPAPAPAPAAEPASSAETSPAVVAAEPAASAASQ